MISSNARHVVGNGKQGGFSPTHSEMSLIKTGETGTSLSFQDVIGEIYS